MVNVLSGASLIETITLSVVDCVENSVGMEQTWHQNSIELQSPILREAIGIWKGNQKAMRWTLRHILEGNTNYMDERLIENIGTIEQAMRPIPVGTILWHGTTNLDFCYDRKQWLSTSLLFADAHRFVSKKLTTRGGCNGQRELFIRLVVEREDVAGIPCKDDDAIGNEMEVLLRHDQVLTYSGQTTVCFSSINYRVQSFTI